jgi:hypothetical protein
MAGTCEYAQGTMPDYYCVTLSGVQNADCTECSQFNGTHLIPQNGPGSCWYQASLPACDYGEGGNLFIAFTDGFLYFFHDSNCVYTLANNSPYVSVANPINIPFDYEATGGCTNWPSSVTIIPNNTGICAGDPHFIGFEGDRFDFHGKPGNFYNLLSDHNVNVVSLFGDYPSVPGTTYLEEMGILVGTERTGFSKIQFSAKKGGIYFNGKLMKKQKETFDTGVGKLGFVTMTGSVAWQGMLANLQDITGGIFQNGIVVNTGTYELRIARFIDSMSHLTFFVKWINLPINPHGLIGQTADFDGKPRIGIGPNGEGVIEGKPEDYMVKNLFDHDFAYSRFGHKSEPKILKI